jgi:uncharacterized protein (TIGR00369 family)
MNRISNLDYLRKLLSGTLTPTDKSPFNFPFPIMKTLGLRLVEVSEGAASMEMEAKTELHSNPMGTIHGGVLCDIADAAIGTAHFTTLTEEESFASIDLQINFFRPVWNERLRAAAKPHRGRKGKSLCVRRNEGGWEVSRASYEHDHYPSRRSRSREMSRQGSSSTDR